MLKLQLSVVEARRLPYQGWYYVSFHQETTAGKGDDLLKTPVIARSEKLSISWRTDFAIPILNTAANLYWKLNMRILHHAQWEVIAQGSLSLGTLPLGVCQPISLKLEYGRILDKIQLDMSVKLDRNDNSIKIVPVDSQSPSKRLEYSAVEAECRTLLAESYFDFVDDMLSRDCVNDAHTLAEEYLLKESTQLEQPSRETLKLRRSSRYSFADSASQFCYPIEDDSIQINLSSDETKFVLIRLSNRFAMWTWAKWLLLANDVWCGAIQGKDLPSWVYQGEDRSSGLSVSFVSQGSVIAYTERTMSGRLSIRLDRPYELVCSSSSSSSSSGAGASNNGSSSNQELSISLKNMVSMVLSADSVVAQRFFCDFRIVSLQWVDETGKSAKKRPSFNLFAGAAHVVKVGASEMARVALSSVLHPRHQQHAESLSFALQSNRSFLLARQEGMSTVLIQSDDDWLGKITVDFSDLNNLSPIWLCIYDSNHHLLCHAVLDPVIMLPTAATLQEASVRDFRHCVSEESLSQSKRSVIRFVSSQGLAFCVTLLSSWDLVLPNSVAGKFSHVFAKCTLLGATGHRNNKATVCFETTLQPISPDVHWHEEPFLFEVGDELHSMEFIRIEIFACGSMKSFGGKNFSFGAAFVPLTSFPSSVDAREFTMSNFRRTKELCAGGSFEQDNCGKGKIKVSLQRIESSQQVCLVEFEAVSRETSLAQTAWAGEAILDPLLARPEVPSEACLVTFGQDVLHVDIGQILDARDNKRRNSLSWRQQIMARSNSLSCVLATSLERSESSPIVKIVYSRVDHCSLVSASILSLRVIVGRLFLNSKGEESFHDAEVDIFISNCPAKLLKEIVEDRMRYCNLRSQLQEIMGCGAVDQRLSTSHSEEADPNKPSIRDMPDSSGDSQLSHAAALFAEIDSRSFEMNQKLSSKCESKDSKSSVRTTRRYIRLRLYMATMLAVGLKGEHNYSAEEVRAIMESDFKRARNISLDNEVATAINRIDYLLDMAEKRLRDAALCGWKFQGPALQRALEILANGYFIEVVSILGVFFEDLGQQQAKGLTSKVELIRTYLKHHDRLDVILQSALRPYGLIAQPPARLSLFLDLSILLAWYSSVLTLEMRARVDSVLDVWKDVSKDVTGRASLYHYPLPWLPQRISSTLSKKDEAEQDSEDGFFCTNIPEDLVEVLRTYLTHARVGQDSLATSLQFSDALTILDSQVCMAYSQAFLYLSEVYQRALSDPRGLDQRAPTPVPASAVTPGGGGATPPVASPSTVDVDIVDEDEFAEYLTFLASVANDAYRVNAQFLFRIADDPIQAANQSMKNSTSEKIVALNTSFVTQEEAVKTAFDDILLRSVEQLSCFVFKAIFLDRDILLSREFHVVWQRTTVDLKSKDSSNKTSGKDGHSDTAVLGIFGLVATDTIDYLNGISDYFTPSVYEMLLDCCVTKVLAMFLLLMRHLRSDGMILSSRNNPDLRSKLLGEFDSLEGALQRLPEEHRTRPLTILSQWKVLIFDDMMTKTFITQAKMLFKECKEMTDVSRRYSTFRLMQTCLAIRGLRSCLATKLVPPGQFQRSLQPMTTGDSASNKADAEIRRLKEEYSEAWIVDMVSEMRKLVGEEGVRKAPGSDSPGDGRNSTSVVCLDNPEGRVFIKDQAKPTVEGLMIRSMLSSKDDASRRESESKDRQNFAIEIPAGNALKAIVASKMNVKRLLGSMSKVTRTRAASAQSTAATRQTLRIVDLAVQGSLLFAAHSAMKAFLKFQLGDEVVRTKSQILKKGEIVRFDDVLELHYRESNDLVRIHVTLWEEVMFIAQKLASFTIEFVAFSPPSFRRKEMEFSDWSTAFRVAYAVKQTTQQGEPLPKLFLSINSI